MEGLQQQHKLIKRNTHAKRVAADKNGKSTTTTSTSTRRGTATGTGAGRATTTRAATGGESTATDGSGGGSDTGNSAANNGGTNTTGSEQLTSIVNPANGQITVVVVISNAPQPTTLSTSSSSAAFNLTALTALNASRSSSSSSSSSSAPATALPTFTSPLALSSAPGLGNDRNGGKSSKGLSNGAIAGLSVASVVAFLALLGLAFLAWKRRADKNKDEDLDDMMGPSRPDPYSEGDGVPGNSAHYSNESVPGPMMREA